MLAFEQHFEMVSVVWAVVVGVYAIDLDFVVIVLMLAVVAVVEVAWFPPSRHVGFVHFRRNWCNNLCVDFLTAHPDIVSNREPIKGVGTALLAGTEVNRRSLLARCTRRVTPRAGRAE